MKNLKESDFSYKCDFVRIDHQCPIECHVGSNSEGVIRVDRLKRFEP
jgi:hypothetical protein